MKAHLKTTITICAVATLLSAGCAKQQIVKQDKIIPPVSSTAAVVPAAPAAKPAEKEVKKPALPVSSVDASQLKKEAELAAATQGASDASLKGALEKIYFDFDSSALSPEARESLAKNADLIKKNQKAKIQIQGNCDELGSDDYNLALGERRANAALNYLKNLGVASDRLSAISYGKEKPAIQGHDEAARAKNRRDEFVVSAK